MAATKKTKRISKPKKTAARKLPHVDPAIFEDETERTIALPVEGQGPLELLVVDYDNKHQLAKRWEELRKETGQEVLAGMKSKRTKTVKAETEKEKLTASLIETERSSVNADKLKKALGNKLWRKVTTPQLDLDKLEAAMTLGEVDPNVVASCTETNEVEYIKVTRRTKK